MSTDSTKVAVSYSWREEISGANAGAVGMFCQQLEAARIPVIRDVDRLKHGECISKFMREIGKSDFLCIFLSDSYLKSPNCMYELLVAWQRSKDHAEEFNSRVKVWVMPSAEGIRKGESRLAYLDYWKAERTGVATLIEKHATDGLAPAELAGFRHVKEFTEHVNEMLCFFADTLAPGTMEQFSDWVVSHFPVGTTREDTSALDQVYANTVNELESVINGNSRLCKFIADSTTDLVCQDGGRWKLCDPVKRRGFDALPHIERIKSRLSLFSGPMSDMNDLELFVGGVVVLAIDPQWILGQRDLLRNGSVEYPALKEFVPLGDGQRAGFLNLVTSALADGHARLRQVFGEPKLDGRRVDEPAAVGRGILVPDEHTELKKHFIRFVLGADIQIDDSDPHAVELLFIRVKDVLRYALKRERNPYFGTGPAYVRLTETIRQHLKMTDLILIQPSGKGSEDELLKDALFLLKDLHEIFETIQIRRANPTS